MPGDSGDPLPMTMETSRHTSISSSPFSVSITGCPAPSPLLSVNCLKPGAIYLFFFCSCLGLISSVFLGF